MSTFFARPREARVGSWRRLPMLGAVAGLAVLTSGCSLWGWGFGHTVGDGGTADRLAPVEIGTSSDWAAVSDGTGNACAIQTDGALWCWGENGTGQIGDGTNVEKYSPVHLGTATWKTVNTHNQHTCGIQSDDSLWCWGYNAEGQLGIGTDGTTEPTRLSPVRVGSAAWKSVAAGGYHTCGIQADDSLWCWGSNIYGQIGIGTDGTTEPTRLSPVRVGSAAWKSVATGGDHTCGIQADGTLWCWGRNQRGQLGDGTKGLDHSSPFQVGAAHWNAVSAGAIRTCGLHTNATLWCWGDNIRNELGTGVPYTVRRRPGRVGTANDWIAISTGGEHQCGIRATASDLRTVWCWGFNRHGELGEGPLGSVMAPQQVGEADHWFAVSTGASSTHALLQQQQPQT